MPNLPPKLPTKLIPRGDFHPADFRTLVAEQGKWVLWEMAELCPCSLQVNKFEDPFDLSSPTNNNAKAGGARADCPLCSGNGYYLYSPQNIKVILHAMALNPRRFGVSGDYARGRARVSTLPENKLSLGDRITLLNSVHRVSEVVVRSSAATQALRFPVVSQTLNLATGPQVMRVLRALRATTAGLSANSQAMVEGTDFTIDVNGKVAWNPLSTNIPAPGDQFAISYYARPRYRVEDSPGETRDAQEHYKTPTAQDVQLPLAYTLVMEYRGDKENPETGGPT